MHDARRFSSSTLTRAAATDKHMHTHMRSCNLACNELASGAPSNPPTAWLGAETGRACNAGLLPQLAMGAGSGSNCGVRWAHQVLETLWEMIGGCTSRMP
jgi:hypothetical protein